jgi:methyl-accepting chemotaxis protein
MFLSRLSVSARFLLVLAIGFTFQAGVSIVSLLDLKNSLMQDRISEVKHLLEAGYSTVALYHDQAVKGLMSDAEARRAAVTALRAMRYDEKNYFCIWDLNGTGVAHGGRPELEGKTFLNSPDAAKNPVVASMVGKLLDVAKSDKKEGALSYWIPKAGQTVPLEKVAYTRLFEPWGWSISTGAYIDDIEAAFRARAMSALWVFIGLIAVASALTFVIGRDWRRRSIGCRGESRASPRANWKVKFPTSTAATRSAIWPAPCWCCATPAAKRRSCGSIS